MQIAKYKIRTCIILDYYGDALLTKLCLVCQETDRQTNHNVEKATHFSILVLKRKKVFLRGSFFLEVIFPRRVLVPIPKIAINLTSTYEKQYCKDECYVFSGQ